MSKEPQENLNYPTNDEESELEDDVDWPLDLKTKTLDLSKLRVTSLKTNKEVKQYIMTVYDCIWGYMRIYE